MIVNRLEMERMDPLLSRFGFERLRPPPDVMNLKWTDQQIFVETQGKRKRKIYFNTPFDGDEQRMIELVKGHLANENLQNAFSDSVILKQIYAAKFSVEKAMERLKQAYSFLCNPDYTRFTYETEQQLQKGYVYTLGYSYEFRPVLYIRPDLIDFSNDRFLNTAYTIFYICQRYRMVPYHCEKLHLVIDLNHMWVSSIPLTKIYAIMKKISVAYCENAEKIYVLNSTGLGAVWFLVKRAMNEQARKRVVFPSKMSELDEFISPDQRQQKYGGRLPNLTSFWYCFRLFRPPTPTYQHRENATIQQKLQRPPSAQRRNPADESFYSVVNNPTYFGITEHEEEVSRCRCHCTIF